MERGKFPYAHLDLLVSKNDTYYLSEIALNGGTKGAKISRQELDRKKQAVLESLLDNLGK
jgi:ribosomal protein S6--L-glutamate ligase